MFNGPGLCYLNPAMVSMMMDQKDSFLLEDIPDEDVKVKIRRVCIYKVYISDVSPGIFNFGLN